MCRTPRKACVQKGVSHKFKSSKFVLIYSHSNKTKLNTKVATVEQAAQKKSYKFDKKQLQRNCGPSNAQWQKRNMQKELKESWEKWTFWACEKVVLYTYRGLGVAQRTLCIFVPSARCSNMTSYNTCLSFLSLCLRASLYNILFLYLLSEDCLNLIT